MRGVGPLSVSRTSVNSSTDKGRVEVVVVAFVRVVDEADFDVNDDVDDDVDDDVSITVLFLFLIVSTVYVRQRR